MLFTCSVPRLPWVDTHRHCQSRHQSWSLESMKRPCAKSTPPGSKVLSPVRKSLPKVSLVSVLELLFPLLYFNLACTQAYISSRLIAIQAPDFYFSRKQIYENIEVARRCGEPENPCSRTRPKGKKYPAPFHDDYGFFPPPTKGKIYEFPLTMKEWYCDGFPRQVSAHLQ